MKYSNNLSESETKEWEGYYLSYNYKHHPISGVPHSVARKTKQGHTPDNRGRPFFIAPFEMVDIITGIIEDKEPEQVFDEIDWVFNTGDEQRVTLSTIKYIYRLYRAFKIDFWIRKQNESYIENMGLEFKYPQEHYSYNYQRKQQESPYSVHNDGKEIRVTRNKQLILLVDTGDNDLNKAITKGVMDYLKGVA